MSTTVVTQPSDALRETRTVLWVTMGLNFVAMLVKLVVGYLTGSLSLIADGFDSLFDAASNVIGLVGVGLAGRPPDAQHPYGHRKAEAITSLVIAMLLFVTTWEIAKSAIERLRNPGLITGDVTMLSFAAIAVSILMHLAVVRYELRAGRRLKSDVLVADAMHTRADVFVSLSVAIGLVAMRLGYPLADPIVALLVAAFVAKIGIDIVREAVGPLMEEAALPPGALEHVILSVPGVVSSHRVRTRAQGAAMIADLHIRVNPSMSAEQAHAIAHEVRRRLAEENPALQDVTVHIEPADEIPDEISQQELTVRLRRLADGLGLGVHHVWADEVDGAYHLELHLEGDGDLPLSDAHAMASELEDRIRHELTEVTEVITHLEPKGQLSSIADDKDEHQRVDRAADAEDLQRLEAVVAEHVGPGTCHHIRIRPGLEGRVVSMRCYLPGDVTLREAHSTVERLEWAVHRELDDVERVVVHTEPRENCPPG